MASTFDLHEIAFCVQTAIGERAENTDPAVFALRDRGPPVDERDAGMAEPQQMLGGEAAAEHVVDGDRGDVPGRAPVFEKTRAIPRPLSHSR